MRNILFLFVALVLVACAEQPKKSTVLVPVEERNTPVSTIDTEVETTKDKVPEKTQTEPVIVALIDEAALHSKQGNSEKASASIERALRIEPRNALLWHHLALIRLQQQQWQQAIILAKKSNALAGKNNQLKSGNWGVIAEAYEKLGDPEKANQARNQQRNQT